jgi:hypothetical protein
MGMRAVRRSVPDERNAMAASTAQPDLSEFYRLSRPKKPPCRVGFALSQLTRTEAKQARAAIDTDAGIITNSAIQQWLASKGHEATVSSIVSHRKNTCTCADG